MKIKDEISALWITIWITIIIFICGFFYLARTRPRIEFIPDKPNSEWTQYLQDPQGFEYPYIRIYHNSFFCNSGKRNFIQQFFESDKYWMGRFTDMSGFLANYGYGGRKDKVSSDKLK